MQLVLGRELVERAGDGLAQELLVGEIQGGLPIRCGKRMGAGTEIDAQTVWRACHWAALVALEPSFITSGSGIS